MILEYGDYECPYSRQAFRAIERAEQELSGRVLTTRRLHRGDTTFQIDFEFVDHALLVRTGDGRVVFFELADGVPVPDFDARLHEALRDLGVDVAI